jgi:hypothetical protein
MPLKFKYDLAIVEDKPPEYPVIYQGVLNSLKECQAVIEQHGKQISVATLHKMSRGDVVATTRFGAIHIKQIPLNKESMPARKKRQYKTEPVPDKEEELSPESEEEEVEDEDEEDKPITTENIVGYEKPVKKQAMFNGKVIKPIPNPKLKKEIEKHNEKLGIGGIGAVTQQAIEEKYVVPKQIVKGREPLPTMNLDEDSYTEGESDDDAPEILPSDLEQELESCSESEGSYTESESEYDDEPPPPRAVVACGGRRIMQVPQSAPMRPSRPSPSRPSPSRPLPPRGTITRAVRR